jgi:putative ABC transport system permease protein
MWKATIRGLFARKVRLALTALAILLGVAFVSATYVLTDSVKRSFDTVFAQTLTGVDLQVQGASALGDGSAPGRIGDSAIADVAAVPGVRTAQGFVRTSLAQFVDANGDTIGGGGPPTFGISWVDDGPLRLTDGRVPDGPDQVAMDAGTARENGFHVGDRVRVLLQGPAQSFRIVGLFGFGTEFEFPATWAAFDLPTAQQAFAAEGELDAVDVIATPGTNVAELRARIADELGPAYDVQFPRDAAADSGKPVHDLLTLLTELLLGFAAIGLVVAAFIIFNTFSILVAQRTRELGLLRAMGASGFQVVSAVLAESAIVGLVASAVGLVLGLATAAGLLALLSAFGFHVPEGPTVLEARTVVAAIGVGFVVTVGSSLIPALRAARIPPIAAIDDVPQSAPRPFNVRAAIGLALIALGLPVLAYGLTKTRNASNVVDEIWLVAVGALMVFFGVIVMLATFARPLADVIGWPAQAFGMTGVLARGNATRNPRRTAATASALVIGLGLVGLVAIFAASTKASVQEAVDHGITADYVLKSQQFLGFSPEVSARAASLPTVEDVATLRFHKVRVGGKEETLAGAEPSGLQATTNLRLSSGSIAGLDPDGILVYKETADDYGVHVGDRLSVQFTGTGFLDLRVAGIYNQEDFVGGFPVPFIVSRSNYETEFGPQTQAQVLYVKSKSAADAKQTGVELRKALHHDFPNVDIFTRAAYRDDQERAIDRFLAVTVALLLLAEIIAVLGIVNTLALSVYERTRELGLLRAGAPDDPGRVGDRRAARGGGRRRHRLVLGMGVHVRAEVPGRDRVPHPGAPTRRVPAPGRARGDRRRVVPGPPGGRPRRARGHRHRVRTLEAAAGPAATLARPEGG